MKKTFPQSLLLLMFGSHISTGAVTIISQYTFEADSMNGTLPQDVSGNGRHFANGGGFLASTYGTAAPGSTTYVTSTSNGPRAYNGASLTGAGANFGFSMWIYATNSTQSQYVIATNNSRNADNLTGARIFIDGGQWLATKGDKDYAHELIGSQAVTTNEWTHLAFYQQDDTAYFLVNGQEVGSLANSGITSSSGIHYGVESGGALSLAGGTGIDNMTFFNFNTTDDVNSFIASTIPEPSSTALLSLGAFSLITRRKR